MSYLSEVFCSIQGEGPWVGERQIFIRYAGCDLRCRWCDTPDSLLRTDTCELRHSGNVEVFENPIKIKTILKWLSDFKKSERVDVVSLTGGEPLLQCESIMELCSKSNYTFSLETGGHRPKELSIILPYLRRVSMDMKLPTSAGTGKLWEEHRSVLDILSKSSVSTYIKCVITADTSEVDIEHAAKLCSSVFSEEQLSGFVLQPVTEGYGKYNTPSSERLYDFQSIVLKHLKAARVIPQIHPVIGCP